jgi:2-polyprenyl-6-hydroxyphenyl methylase/3-demethylubiquinone-9 3-methyltransferase
MKSTLSNQVDSGEIARFEALASEWWDVDGPMAPLHRMNPVRLDYIISRIRSHYGNIEGLRILDVGCGGGLVTEPLARLGAIVTGIDGAGDLIKVAQQRAKDQQLNLTYENILTGNLIARKKTFDVVLGLEIIEHVPDQPHFISDLAKLVNKNGLIITSTLNRTPQSFAFGIIAAERILNWLPQGTHDWKKFVKPSEMMQWADEAGLDAKNVTGVVYKPFSQSFELDTRNVAVNYLFTAVKK